MKDSSFSAIQDLARSLVADGDFSKSDLDRIAAAVEEQGDDRLTDAQRKELLRTVDAFSQGPTKKVPVAMRVLGAVALLAAVFAVGEFVVYVASVVSELGSGVYAQHSITELVIDVILIVLLLAQTVVAGVLGARLLLNKRTKAARLTYVAMALSALTIFFLTMVQGVSLELSSPVGYLVLQIVLSAYLQPSLARERQLKNFLKRLDTKERAAKGTLGLDLDGEGYIKLDFFNLFWIFVIACFLGLIVEIIWHMVVVDPGVYQDRTGLLYGPFSPIYGVGCVLMTLALNRFRNKNIILIFVVCTIIGGTFEYCVSWWMEIGFGAKAWDYSDKFLGDLLGGRTCLMFASMFGVLGTFWIKLLLPLMLKLINLIPWKARYAVTAVCAALMAVNCVMTVQSLDCWYERVSGKPVVTDVQKFFAENYDDEYMQNRFESMSIEPDLAARDS
ncbi:MAG: putative ABC transporter permease [Coriobacteriia bacterium]|nr:putative ABC transporter permease [Coriobacteriia bacterium]